MDLEQKPQSKDVIENPGMSGNVDLLVTGGGVNNIELTPTNKEAEIADASSGRKRCLTETSEISIGPVNSGASASTNSSPAKKNMEAMKSKHLNAGISNQVVPIASLFLGNPR